jgi:hypothetical protein
MDYNCELTQFLHDHNVLTVNWAANKLQVNVRFAAKLFEQFRASNSAVKGIFRVASRDLKGNLIINVIEEHEY